MEEETQGFPGRAASKGIAYGKAVWIEHPNYESSFFNEGDILVTHMTDVDYLPLMRKAAAVVTSVGGRFSHASVLCNQMKKPCVVSVQNTNRFHGIDVTVDGTKGIVFIGKRDV